MLISATAPNEQVLISVYLKRDTHDNGMTLQEYSDAVVAGEQPILGHEAFVYQFGATEDSIVLVTSWAAANNLTVVEALSGTATVKLLGTADQFNKLFNINLQTITDTDRTYISHGGNIIVPSEITEIVDFILGLDNSVVFRSHAVVNEPITDITTAYPTTAYMDPPKVATAYSLPAGNGYGETIAILELSYAGGWSGFTTNDVNLQAALLGLPAPEITTVIVDNALTTATSDSESMLDITCAWGVAPKAKLIYYLAPNSSQGFLDCILAVANDSTNNPSVLSISWGADEFSDYLTSGFTACVARGITCFASSGDAGANNLTCLYPATSPYVVSSGGTTIFLNADNTLNYETAWNTGGGGVSAFITLPSWQSGLTYTNYSNNTGTYNTATVLTHRGFPDVSAPSNPQTGYRVFVNGLLYGVGGTSAASPFLAGMVARLNALLGKRIGFANPTFYNNPSIFRDITTGSNARSLQGYITTPGWDAVTGLGAPIGTSIYQLYHTGSTFPKQNYGFRPKSGPTYPRKTTGAR